MAKKKKSKDKDKSPKGKGGKGKKKDKDDDKGKDDSKDADKDGDKDKDKDEKKEGDGESASPAKEEPIPDPGDEKAQETQTLKDIMDKKMFLWNEIMMAPKDEERKECLKKYRHVADEELRIIARSISKTKLKELIDQKLNYFVQIGTSDTEAEKIEGMKGFRRIGEEEAELAAHEAPEIAERFFPQGGMPGMPPPGMPPFGMPPPGMPPPGMPPPGMPPPGMPPPGMPPPGMPPPGMPPPGMPPPGMPPPGMPPPGMPPTPPGYPGMPSPGFPAPGAPPGYPPGYPPGAPPGFPPGVPPGGPPGAPPGYPPGAPQGYPPGAPPGYPPGAFPGAPQPPGTPSGYATPTTAAAPGTYPIQGPPGTPGAVGTPGMPATMGAATTPASTPPLQPGSSSFPGGATAMPGSPGQLSLSPSFANDAQDVALLEKMADEANLAAWMAMLAKRGQFPLATPRGSLFQTPSPSFLPGVKPSRETMPGLGLQATAVPSLSPSAQMLANAQLQSALKRAVSSGRLSPTQLMLARRLSARRVPSALQSPVRAALSRERQMLQEMQNAAQASKRRQRKRGTPEVRKKSKLVQDFAEKIADEIASNNISKMEAKGQLREIVELENELTETLVSATNVKPDVTEERLQVISDLYRDISRSLITNPEMNRDEALKKLKKVARLEHELTQSLIESDETNGDGVFQKKEAEDSMYRLQQMKVDLADELQQSMAVSQPDAAKVQDNIRRLYELELRLMDRLFAAKRRGDDFEHAGRRGRRPVWKEGREDWRDEEPQPNVSLCWGTAKVEQLRERRAGRRVEREEPKRERNDGFNGERRGRREEKRDKGDDETIQVRYVYKDAPEPKGKSYKALLSPDSSGRPTTTVEISFTSTDEEGDSVTPVITLTPARPEPQKRADVQKREEKNEKPHMCPVHGDSSKLCPVHSHSEKTCPIHTKMRQKQKIKWSMSPEQCMFEPARGPFAPETPKPRTPRRDKQEKWQRSPDGQKAKRAAGMEPMYQQPFQPPKLPQPSRGRTKRGMPPEHERTPRQVPPKVQPQMPVRMPSGMPSQMPSSVRPPMQPYQMPEQHGMQNQMPYPGLPYPMQPYPLPPRPPYPFPGQQLPWPDERRQSWPAPPPPPFDEPERSPDRPPEEPRVIIPTRYKKLTDAAAQLNGDMEDVEGTYHKISWEKEYYPPSPRYPTEQGMVQAMEPPDVRYIGQMEYPEPRRPPTTTLGIDASSGPHTLYTDTEPGVVSVETGIEINLSASGTSIAPISYQPVVIQEPTVAAIQTAPPPPVVAPPPPAPPPPPRHSRLSPLPYDDDEAPPPRRRRSRGFKRTKSMFRFRDYVDNSPEEEDEDDVGGDDFTYRRRRRPSSRSRRRSKFRRRALEEMDRLRRRRPRSRVTQRLGQPTPARSGAEDDLSPGVPFWDWICKSICSILPFSKDGGGAGNKRTATIQRLVDNVMATSQEVVQAKRKLQNSGAYNVEASVRSMGDLEGKLWKLIDLEVDLVNELARYRWSGDVQDPRAEMKLNDAEQKIWRIISVQTRLAQDLGDWRKSSARSLHASAGANSGGMLDMPAVGYMNPGNLESSGNLVYQANVLVGDGPASPPAKARRIKKKRSLSKKSRPSILTSPSPSPSPSPFGREESSSSEVVPQEVRESGMRQQPKSFGMMPSTNTTTSTTSSNYSSEPTTSENTSTSNHTSTVDATEPDSVTITNTIVISSDVDDIPPELKEEENNCGAKPSAVSWKSPSKEFLSSIDRSQTTPVEWETKRRGKYIYVRPRNTKRYTPPPRRRRPNSRFIPREEREERHPKEDKPYDPYHLDFSSKAYKNRRRRRRRSNQEFSPPTRDYSGSPRRYRSADPSPPRRRRSPRSPRGRRRREDEQLSGQSDTTPDYGRRRRRRGFSGSNRGGVRMRPRRKYRSVEPRNSRSSRYSRSQWSV